MFILIAINYWSNDVSLNQNQYYGQTQMANEDNYTNKEQIPEINNAVNPRMMDTNFYYQPSSKNDKGQPAK